MSKIIASSNHRSTAVALLAPCDHHHHHPVTIMKSMQSMMCIFHVMVPWKYSNSATVCIILMKGGIGLWILLQVFDGIFRKFEIFSHKGDGKK